MILCAGEALIDMLPATTADGRAAFVPAPGGAVFNTARALGRLGAPSGYLGPLSRDPFGDMLAGALAEAGVDAALCPRPDRPTTMAFVMFEAGQPRYAFHDRHTALSGLTSAEMPALPEAGRTLFLGGISLAAEGSGPVFAGLAARAGERVLMLDPNIRPGFVTDEGAYRARLADLIARADILKLSDEDLRWLDDAPEAQAIARLRATGPALVLLTRGGAGAEAHYPGGVLHVPARRVTVVDTVGAGDTFNAGILTGLYRAGALDRAALRALGPDVLAPALALGVAAAGIVVGRPGADPPRASELADFL
jgi:fructokinase